MIGNFIAGLFASLVLFGATVSATAAMLGFDDITPHIPNGSWGYIVEVPDGYGGLNWWYSWGSSNSVIATKGHSAFDDGVVSPEFAAVIGGGTAEIWVTDNTFDFVGAYFTGGWYTVSATVEGYLGDVLQYSRTVTAHNGTPTWYEFNFTGIDTLVFPAGGSNQDFVMDNFTYNHCQVVPEPASLILLSSGLAGIAALRRKKQ